MPSTAAADAWKSCCGSWRPCSSAFGPGLGLQAWGFFGGFVGGYLAYDMIHYSVHHWTNMKSPLMRKIRRHHMAHHFRDTNKGFGVSSYAWDRVFRT